MAVSAAGTAYQSNQSSKAAKKAGQTKYNTTPQLLGDPAQVDPSNVLLQTYMANGQNYVGAKEQAKAINQFNYGQANKYYNQIQPYFNELQAQIGQNALSYAQGNLPSDVQDNITRMTAQRGIQAGIGYGSQGARNGAFANLNARNLGLSSLDLSKYGTQLGMQVNQNAKALLPNLSGLQDFFLNPSQVAGIQQNNASAQNQFALQNNQLLNAQIAAQNQQLYNQTQGQYANSLQQAQAVGQTAQQVGGLISSLGSSGALTGSAQGWGGDYSPTGTGYASYRGSTIPKAQLA